MANAGMKELTEAVYDKLKIEGKTIREWREEIDKFRAFRDGIITCSECMYQGISGKCYLASLAYEQKVPDTIHELDYFFCADGRRKK